MILCNLLSLLAEKRINISKASRDTGISRTTLTSLCTNTCQGVQLDTVNTLCKYLDVGIEQLFLLSKYDFQIRLNVPLLEYQNFPQNSQGYFEIIIDYFGKKTDCTINCDMYFHYEKSRITWLEASLEFYDEDSYSNDDPVKADVAEENRILRKVLSDLQSPFKNWLRNTIVDKIYYEYDEFFVDGYEISIDYPQEFK